MVSPGVPDLAVIVPAALRIQVAEHRVQRDLGAAKASTCYAVAPFIGVLLSFVIFREIPGVLFFIALSIMIAGTWMVNRE